MKIQTITFLFLLLTSFQLSSQEWHQKIDVEVLAELELGATTEVIIAFHEQANLSAAYQLKTKKDKGQFVYEQVQQVSQRSQATVKTILETASKSYRSLAIVNAILVEVDLSLAQQIVAQTTVKNIQPNPWTAFDAPVFDHSLSNNVRGGGDTEWGITNIQADLVWNLGFQGQGVIVGGQDTGYEWEHPAIKEKYRGWDGESVDHNFNWHDSIHEIDSLHNDTIISPDNNPCGLDSSFPCDDHNHGTHTVGTMVGGQDVAAGENKIGVAPMAQWIGCRNMERGWGSPASYIECFDWFLAPTDLNGENADPEASPHVINNSWGCPPIEGCNSANFELMEIALNTLKASGVVVVVSAGNSGPGCNSVDDPSAIFEGSFTIGASNRNDSIAGFSSRGSVAVDSSFRLKPNVVAPGVGVRSSIRGGNYATWNGTSMAGPHVAGAVALIISAVPELAGQVDAIEDILEATTLQILSEQDCDQFPGMAIPNATYGYGRIDVFAAVMQALDIVAVHEEATINIELFPNPSSESVWIKGWTGNTAIEFSLFDMNGRQLLIQPVDRVFEKVDLSHLAKGLYHYRLAGSGLFKVGKLVVQ